MMRIAVLDDDTSMLELTALHLEKVGYSVRRYLNAKMFLESLKERSPDLLVMDMVLPGIAGN